MKNIFPHLLAIAVFYLITLIFFSPAFFDNKTLSQHDVQQFMGSAKVIADYRDATGREALWVPNMFSGMPAYLVSVQWSVGPMGIMKQVLGGFLPSPYRNIFIAFVCYYIMLLSFRVRPLLALTGALAFGLSSYMIIGLMAGHNTRIGAAALMPLVLAGIHLAFTGKRILGAGVMAAGLALHLRENHLQITYYLLLMVIVYGFVQLILAVKEKTLPDFAKNVGVLVVAALIAVGTFVGPLWAVEEYSKYSIRGKSEIQAPGAAQVKDGLERDYAFQYSNGILEPITLFVPNFYGGSSMNYLVQDRESEVYKALVNSGNEQTANQLASYTSAYWGPQPLTAPYYGGAIIFFLFIVGMFFAERRYVVWLVPISIVAVMLTWGDHFKVFNYFMLDHFPLYNKFRSVTFTIIIVLVAMPLLGMLGLEKILANGMTPPMKKKLLFAFGIAGGACVLILLLGGMMSFLRDFESSLPVWFTDALADDRRSLLYGDAIRSLCFMAAIFIILYFEAYKKISPVAVMAFLVFMSTVDIFVVDKRFVSKENFQRKREIAFYQPNEADQEIAKDKSYYRVYNLQDPWSEARTSYFHNSVGGYHGAKLRRYQDLYDSCLLPETQRLIQDAQTGRLNFNAYGVLNMLNVKYITYGPGRDNVILNPANNGSAWFVKSVKEAQSPTEELAMTANLATRDEAVVDVSKFKVGAVQFDSTATIALTAQQPDQLTYEVSTTVNGLAVFSEIYYPKGWIATVDGKEVPIVRVNYVLRALEIPAGKHTVVFAYKPAAYYTGNTITQASSWLMFLLLIGSIALTIRNRAK